MKKTLFFLATIAFALSVDAQQSRQDIKANTNLAGSNYVAYPGPRKALTAAPEGYTPYYISHYGRHGSRYLIETGDYDKPYLMLMGDDTANSHDWARSSIMALRAAWLNASLRCLPGRPR